MRNPAGQILFALGLTLGLAFAAGCRSARPSAAPARPPLRIGVVADAPPLIFRHHGTWTGAEADLGRALADRLGMKPVFVACPAERLTDALLGGRVDILMAGLAVTDERRIRLDFASPYLVVGQAALIRAEDLLRFNTEIKIRTARSRAGVVADSAGDRLVSRYFSRAERIVFPRAAEAVDALLASQIDMLIHDAPAAWWLSLSRAERLSVAPALFAREEIAWAFRRGSVTLRESANRALADWEKDGTLESILRRWIPFSK